MYLYLYFILVRVLSYLSLSGLFWSELKAEFFSPTFGCCMSGLDTNCWVLFNILSSLLFIIFVVVMCGFTRNYYMIHDHYISMISINFHIICTNWILLTLSSKLKISISCHVDINWDHIIIYRDFKFHVAVFCSVCVKHQFYCMFSWRLTLLNNTCFLKLICFFIIF